MDWATAWMKKRAVWRNKSIFDRPRETASLWI
jgi:hypothetical protein